MKQFYTYTEEQWNTWTHAAGCLMVAAVGGALLAWCVLAGDGWATLGVALMLAGMLGSYGSSTTYHALPQASRWKPVARRMDHAAIYWNIAGSYSAITLVALRLSAGWGWGLFAFVWLCAAVGTVMAIVRLSDHSHLETLCYCLMGLSVLVAFRPLLAAVSTAAIVWLVAEGVAFITGAVFYSFHGRAFMHTVFHFFVLMGSLCHLMCVYCMLCQYL